LFRLFIILNILRRFEDQFNLFSRILAEESFDLIVDLVLDHLEQIDFAFIDHIHTFDPDSDQFNCECIVFPSLLAEVIHEDDMSGITAAKPLYRESLVAKSDAFSEFSAIAVDLLYVGVIAVLKFVTLSHVLQVVDHNNDSFLLGIRTVFLHAAFDLVYRFLVNTCEVTCDLNVVICNLLDKSLHKALSGLFVGKGNVISSLHWAVCASGVEEYV